jgi:hypothetical protein
MRDRIARRFLCLTALGVVLITTGVAAQFALDAGLSASGRINAPRSAPVINRPVFTVNRATGEMQHNRANAFNDPTYNIHQRYTHDRFENFTPAGVSTAAAAARPTGQSSRAFTAPFPTTAESFRRQSNSGFTSFGTTRPPGAGRASRAGFAPGSTAFSTPTYRAASPPRAASPSLRMPTYSVARH